MISLDTNILVRFFAKDDIHQLQQVLELFHKLENHNRQAYIPLLVILETNWVLGHFYKIERLQIIESLLVLCHMPILLIENVDAIREMLVNAKNNTFDKKVSKIDNFIALKDVI